MADPENVSRAARDVMSAFDGLAPRHIMDAAPEGKEDEAREVAQAVEDIYMDVDNQMGAVVELMQDGGA